MYIVVSMRFICGIITTDVEHFDSFKDADNRYRTLVYDPEHHTEYEQVTLAEIIAEVSAEDE